MTFLIVYVTLIGTIYTGNDGLDGASMKKGIHPEYREITVVMTDGTTFKTRSTMNADSIKLDIDPLTHQAWTGDRQRMMDLEGWISKFNKKYGFEE